MRNKQDKWGWVIYRCSYEDDEAWERFKKIVNQRTRRQVLESDAPELLESLEWTFVEDRSTLEGIPRDQLRSLFKDWAAEAIKAEQPRATDHIRRRGGPRYWITPGLRHSMNLSPRTAMRIPNVARTKYLSTLDEVNVERQRARKTSTLRRSEIRDAFVHWPDWPDRPDMI